jgi:hypothetical protein
MRVCVCACVSESACALRSFDNCWRKRLRKLARKSVRQSEAVPERAGNELFKVIPRLARGRNALN